MPTVEEILRSAKKAKPYKVMRSPDGSIHIEANGEEDHRFAMEAWDRVQVEGIGPLANEPFVQQLAQDKSASAKRAQALGRPSGLPVTPPDAGALLPKPRVSASSSSLRGGVPPLAIGKAAVKWLANIKPDTLRKTFIIKSAAINGFVDFYGDKKPLNDVTRVKVGEWVDAMKAKGLTTPTLVNKTSYLKGFFEWARARGLYVSDDNPAQGQVVYRTREKRARRAMGFKAFPASQVRILFHQDGFRHLSPAARWGAVVGLYTGMRVAEVGQLAWLISLKLMVCPAFGSPMREPVRVSKRIRAFAPFRSIHTSSSLAC